MHTKTAIVQSGKQLEKAVKMVVLFALIGVSDLYAQQPPAVVNDIVAAIKTRKKSKVLILGTFHFRDGGNDAYKPKFPLNVTSAKRQAEVNQLLDILEKFRPTKVSVENMPARQRFHDSLYAEFRAGRYVPAENEIYQVSYQLAKRMGHTNVYTIDAPERTFEPYLDPDSMAIVLHQEQFLKDTFYATQLFKLYAIEDSLKSVYTIKDMLVHLNNPAMLQVELGHYLTGTFKAGIPGNYAGADAATGWWNRNLRIFSNILRLAAGSDEERVFVMIGAGHLQILRLLAMACPDIEFIDAYDFLRKN